jgi:hypothetical protein
MAKFRTRIQFTHSRPVPLGSVLCFPPVCTFVCRIFRPAFCMHYILSTRATCITFPPHVLHALDSLHTCYVHLTCTCMRFTASVSHLGCTIFFRENCEKEILILSHSKSNSCLNEDCFILFLAFKLEGIENLISLLLFSFCSAFRALQL